MIPRRIFLKSASRETTRNRILAENPVVFYGFAKTA
jgi:hypothetical protein